MFIVVTTYFSHRTTDKLIWNWQQHKRVEIGKFLREIDQKRWQFNLLFSIDY